MSFDHPVLDLPMDEQPEGKELIEAAMQWHFGPDTGSPFWLEKAKTLDFDPRTDVRSFGDLTLFPNVVNELREVRVEELIPRGYGDRADVVGVFESGGTTGAPKRVVCLADWLERYTTWVSRNMDQRGFARGVNYVNMVPTGPHAFGHYTAGLARMRGGAIFNIDMDPRWVKRCIAGGHDEHADQYADHLVEQGRHLLETQDVGVLVITPPLLARLARDDRLVDLVNQKVGVIYWAGTHMDADTRYLLRTELFPEAELFGAYGSTMVLCVTLDRLGQSVDDPCVFDPFSPYISFSVVRPGTRDVVPYGERGQVVMNHISKAMFMPNNLERDEATRVEPLPGQLGDSVADVTPVAVFDDETVIEGVY
ncbi:phenazine antibiotic biosynthesis protein [Actinoallomurus sp. NPDC052274]|uniref:phenazine antibiotic biosynthesis protein n=1 Tax=Actinoallomurus sp. NPDC052274 TaxID=3155420 RepID=UPI00343E5577